MESFILWLGFIGAWLLFAGPIYQAALELQDEDIEIDRIRATGSQVPKPAPAPAWLWLVFPVKLFMDFRRNKQHQLQVAKLLSPKDIESLTSFRSKATGWLYVALGGFCIALKETYELGHHNGWGDGFIVALMIGISIIILINHVRLLKRSRADFH